MKNLKLSKNVLLLVLSLALIGYAKGQPTGKKISEQEASAKISSGQTAVQTTDKTKI